MLIAMTVLCMHAFSPHQRLLLCMHAPALLEKP